MKLSELLVYLRQQLNEASDKKKQLGLEHKFKISLVNIELYFETIDKTEAGADFKLINFGSKGSKKDGHKISIELKPLKRKNNQHFLGKTQK